MAFEPKLRFKPHPDSLLYICSQWGIPASEALFVGDSLKDDVSLTYAAPWQPPAASCYLRVCAVLPN